MLDIKLIRKNPKAIETLLQTKDPAISLDRVISLDEELRSLKTEVESLKASRNEHSQKIGTLKRQGVDVSQLMQEVTTISEKIHLLDPRIHEMEKAFEHELASLPNLPM